MITEAYIEKTVTDWAKERGWIVLKFTPRGDRGWPDRLFISRWGSHVWIEFKRPGKEPTKLQHKRLQQLQDNKCHAVWTNSIEDGINYLKEYM